MFFYDTTSEAYQSSLMALLDHPDFNVRPRELPCSELMNYGFVVQRPTSGSIVTKDNERNAKLAAYLKIEKELYLSNERRAEVWARKASKFWATIANEDGTINSNYGWLIFMNASICGLTPWEWAKRSLTIDRESRQAYVRVALPEHQRYEVKDQVCTLHLMFMIRGEKLHATTVMRSNDVVKGLPYDMPWFCYLLERMAEELNEITGSYTHFAHSFHLYDKDRRLAEKMVGR